METTKRTELQDFDVNIKIKLAGIWAATTLCYLYGDYFELYTPGKVDSLITGKNVLSDPLTLFIASVILVIPSLMVFLSLVLKPRLNKFLNILFGSLFTLMMVMIAIGSWTSWYSFYVFLAIVEAILTFIIVWKAIHWPRTSS